MSRKPGLAVDPNGVLYLPTSIFRDDAAYPLMLADHMPIHKFPKDKHEYFRFEDVIAFYKEGSEMRLMLLKLYEKALANLADVPI